MPDIDWQQLFAFELSPFEIVLRGSAMYWFLFLLFRFVLHRNVGSISIADVLLLVLIADASQNAMSGEYQSIGEGCLLVATIAFWNYALDWAAFRSKAVRRVLQPSALPLVKNGQLLRPNLRREFITIDELMAELRKQGLERLDQVKSACMETDGVISIVPVEGAETSGADAEKPAVS